MIVYKAPRQKPVVIQKELNDALNLIGEHAVINLGGFKLITSKDSDKLPENIALKEETNLEYVNGPILILKDLSHSGGMNEKDAKHVLQSFDSDGFFLDLTRLH